MFWRSGASGLRKKNGEDIFTATKGRNSPRGSVFACWGGVIGTVTTLATKDNLVCEIYESDNVCDERA